MSQGGRQANRFVDSMSTKHRRSVPPTCLENLAASRSIRNFFISLDASKKTDTAIKRRGKFVGSCGRKQFSGVLIAWLLTPAAQNGLYGSHGCFGTGTAQAGMLRWPRALSGTFKLGCEDRLLYPLGANFNAQTFFDHP